MQKMLRSKHLLESCVSGLSELHENIENCKQKEISELKDDKGKIDSVTILKRFDTLCGMYNRESTTPYAKDIVEKAVKHVTGVDIKTMKENEVFSSYKRRGKWREVELSKSIEEIYVKFPELLEYLRVDFSKRSINDIPEYLDAVEIEKIRSGIMTMFFDTEIRKEKMKKLFSEKYFPSLHAYLHLAGDDILNGDKINTIMQRYIFAEIRGVLNVLSKKEFVERYVVQPIGINKKKPIIYDKESNRWYICNEKPNNTGKNDDQTEWYLLSGKDAEKGMKNCKIPEQNNILSIQSSKYQMQFLTESSPYFSKSFSKKFDVKILEYSFIVEDTYTIDFSQDEPHIKRQDDKTNLYVSVPFELTAKNREGKVVDKLKEKLNKRDRYLGIDVGEYGLAFSVIEPESGKILHNWFEYEPGIRTVRSTYKLNQGNQKTGTFTFANTRLANIRKDIAHKIRSRIHDIVVRYNAVPAYEFSISNFETGSSRLTALYKTIKTSDTFFDGNDAEKAQRNHTWGMNVLIGKHKSSFGTSYTCTKCWRCLYTICNTPGEYEYKRIDGSNYIILSFNGNEVYGYYEKSNDSHGKLKNDEKNKDAMKIVKDFARPPVFYIKKDNKDNVISIEINKEISASHPVLNESKIKKYGKPDDWKEFCHQSGNSGIFVCPFKDCGHISDADIQASLLIGLRAWYKDKKEENIKKKAGESDKEKKGREMVKELEYYKSMNLTPIELVVPRKDWNDCKKK